MGYKVMSVHSARVWSWHNIVVSFLLICTICVSASSGTNFQTSGPVESKSCPLHLKKAIEQRKSGNGRRLLMLIGPHKTGSTAIQADVSACAELLSYHNWVVPKLFGYTIGVKGHHVIASALISGKFGSSDAFSPDFWRDTEHIYTSHSSAATGNASLAAAAAAAAAADEAAREALFEERAAGIANKTVAEMLRLVTEEIRTAFRAGKSVILASESLSGLSSHQSFQALREMTHGQVETDIVMVYRDPLTWFKSHYEQFFASSNVDNPPSFVEHLYAYLSFPAREAFLGDRLTFLKKIYGETFPGAHFTLLDFDGMRSQSVNFFDVVACEVMGLQCASKDRVRDADIRMSNGQLQRAMNLRITANNWLSVHGCEGKFTGKYYPMLEEAILHDYGDNLERLPWRCNKLNGLRTVLSQRDQEWRGGILTQLNSSYLYGSHAIHPYEKDEDMMCLLDHELFFKNKKNQASLRRLAKEIPTIHCEHMD